MSRLALCLCLLAAGCSTAEPPRDVIQPAAPVPAPDRLTQPNVTTPVAQAPTAKGTYTSMSPSYLQHTPPRPHTR